MTDGKRIKKLTEIDDLFIIYHAKFHFFFRMYSINMHDTYMYSSIYILYCVWQNDIPKNLLPCPFFNVFSFSLSFMSF